MGKYRDAMHGSENLSWCKPVELVYRGKLAIIAQNEGTIAGLQIDGKDAPPNFATLIEHLGIQGADDLQDLYNHRWDGDEVSATDMGCRDCPWFATCEAMDVEAEKGHR